VCEHGNIIPSSISIKQPTGFTGGLFAFWP